MICQIKRHRYLEKKKIIAISKLTATHRDLHILFGVQTIGYFAVEEKALSRGSLILMHRLFLDSRRKLNATKFAAIITYLPSLPDSEKTDR